MKKTLLLMIIFMVVSSNAHAERQRPAMSKVHSDISDALALQKQLQRNYRHRSRTVYEMLEQGRYVTEEAEYNKARYRRNKKIRKRQI